MLPGTNSIMVNTTPSGVDNELIKELLYFNFLEPGGEVWDLSLSPIETALVKEAEEIGTRVVRGSEVASWVDVVWAKWVFGYELDRNSYLKSLTEMLNKNLPPKAT
jgi:shikimate 5-dehydrogenase